MVCAICGQDLVADPPMGYLHLDRSRFGRDGHEVVPISREAATH